MLSIQGIAEIGDGVKPGRGQVQGPRGVKPGQEQGTETVKVDTRDREMKGYSQNSLLSTCRVTVDG